MVKRIKRGWPSVSLIAMMVTLSGCGTSDLANNESPSGSDPLVFASATPLPKTDPVAPSGSITSDSERMQALRRIMHDQTRTMAAYTAVRDQQEDLFYTAVAAIEEGLRLGAPLGSPALLDHWQTAANASQQIGLALNQLNTAIATYLPAIEEAEALRAPFAATLRSQQDSAQDELRRQKGLMEFENNKLVILHQAIAQGLAPPPPLEPILSAEDEAFSIDGPGDESAAMTEEKELDAETPPDLPPEITLESKLAAVSPLVIIRFSRPNIVFRAQLNDALQQAKALNPEGQIHLVAVAPQRKTGQEQLLAQAESHQYAQSILRAVQALGVPTENIRITAQTSQTADSSEVHIYADE